MAVIICFVFINIILTITMIVITMMIMIIIDYVDYVYHLLSKKSYYDGYYGGLYHADGYYSSPTRMHDDDYLELIVLLC